VNVAVTCVPVPLKAIVWVPVPALSCSVKVPVLPPWEFGVNVTLMAHELPAKIVPLQVFPEMAKLPDIVCAALNVKPESPVLFTVNTSGALVVFTG